LEGALPGFLVKPRQALCRKDSQETSKDPAASRATNKKPDVAAGCDKFSIKVVPDDGRDGE